MNVYERELFLVAGFAEIPIVSQLEKDS